jgi:hypothetical protein
VRTTLSLDDDVAVKLKSEARRTGRTIKAVVNDALRRGLSTPAARRSRAPFRVKARDLGRLKPGVAAHHLRRVRRRRLKRLVRSGLLRNDMQ